MNRPRSAPATSLKVLFVTPECAPLIKTGGLGDVSGALPPALRRLRVDARVLLPGYPAVLAACAGARELATIRLDAPPVECRLLWARPAGGVPLYIMDCPALYQRGGGPYMDVTGAAWPDNAQRFGALSRVAALLGSTASPLAWRAQVVHCNDWQTGLAPAYLHYTGGAHAASLFTAHNLAFHGTFGMDMVAALGLPPESYNVEGLEFYGHMSFLKAALHYADALTTVSPTYAREIQTPEFGAGMDGILRARAAVLTGIRNGIDTRAWNPAADRLIPRRYGRHTLNAKRANKLALQRRMRLAVEPDTLLFGLVSRFTHQKGTDLIAAAFAGSLPRGCQLAALGAGEPGHEEAMRGLAAANPGRVAVTIGFDEPLAHLIEAGADCFLMPSRFEPCGLNQMYSLRYGTPPIARATGGLADSIVDSTPETLAAGTATGFLFERPDVDELAGAIARATAVYGDTEAWRRLQRAGMATDFSWADSARRYLAVYERIARAVPQG